MLIFAYVKDSWSANFSHDRTKFDYLESKFLKRSVNILRHDPWEWGHQQFLWHDIINRYKIRFTWDHPCDLPPIFSLTSGPHPPFLLFNTMTVFKDRLIWCINQWWNVILKNGTHCKNIVRNLVDSNLTKRLWQ